MQYKYWVKRISIRNKILLALLVIILLTNVVSFFGLSYTVRMRMEPFLIIEQMNHLRQIAENLDAVSMQLSESAIEIYLDLESRINGNPQFLEQRETCSVLFSTYYRILTAPMRSYRYIHSMLLITNSNHFYFESKNHQIGMNHSDLFGKISKLDFSNPLINWIPIPDNEFFLSPEGDELISMVIPITRNNSIIAYLLINLEEEQFDDFLVKAQNDDVLILQLSPVRNLFVNSWEPDRETSFILHQFDRQRQEETSDYYIFTEHITSTGWNLSMLCQKDILRQSLFDSISAMLVLLVISLFALGILGFFIVYEITDPIKKLTREIEISEKSGELRKLSFTPRTNDEVGQLFTTYNQLIEKIQDTMQELEAEKESSRLTYLQALQMQINPHFLYNSLGNLRYLVEMKDPRATDMIVALGDYYKLAVVGTDDETSISTELQMTESYLRIMKMRYGSKFDYVLRNDPELDHNSIVKLSIQPLAENAIYHGLKQKRGKGILLIRTYREEDMVIVEVYDNGNGMPAEKVEGIKQSLNSIDKIQSSEHVGMLNVNQRIKIHFGEKYGIKIDSRETEYTSAKIYLPVRRYSEKEQKND